MIMERKVYTPIKGDKRILKEKQKQKRYKKINKTSKHPPNHTAA